MRGSAEWLTISTSPAPWLLLRFYLNALFSVEALLRIIGHVPLRRALYDRTLWLDFISVVPFWLRVFIYPESVTAAGYLLRLSRPAWLRVLESAGRHPGPHTRAHRARGCPLRMFSTVPG